MGIFILLLLSGSIFAQTDGEEVEPSYWNAYEIRHDNDFLLFTDRYYTSGTFLGLWANFDSKTDSLTSYQYRFYVVHEIYTPADLLETDPDRIGRPYAGFLGFDNALRIFKPDRFFDYQFYWGTSGPFSGAETFQSAFHSSGTENSRVATWDDQIENALHVNGYFTYLREWQLEPNPFAVFMNLRPKAAFGTRDVYGEYGMSFFFGRRDPMGSTSAYGRYGTNREWYFSVDLTYRHVLHNASYEGSLAGDNSPLTRDVYPNLFLYDFRMVHRRGRNVYKISYHFNTAERRNIQPHVYMGFSFSRFY